MNLLSLIVQHKGTCILNLMIFSFRLIRGDGEIMEEIVSKDKQREINKVSVHAHKIMYDHDFIHVCNYCRVIYKGLCWLLHVVVLECVALTQYLDVPVS